MAHYTTVPVAPSLFQGHVGKAAFSVGMAFLLGTAPSANATGSVLTNPPSRVQMFINTGKRDAASITDVLGAPTADVAEKLISELGRLSDGWSGESSLAPSAHVQADVAKVLSGFVLRAATHPDVEVDDDGSVALRWLVDKDQLLSMEFRGRGKVVCSFVHADPSRSRVEFIPVGNDLAIHRFVEDTGVRSKLFHHA